MYYLKVEFALPEVYSFVHLCPGIDYNLGLSIFYSEHDYLRSIPFSIFIHLIAVTQFSSTANIIDYNYICFLFAIELKNFSSGNNVLFSWAGSSGMQWILGKNCEH